MVYGVFTGGLPVTRENYVDPRSHGAGQTRLSRKTSCIAGIYLCAMLFDDDRYEKPESLTFPWEPSALGGKETRDSTVTSGACKSQCLRRWNEVKLPNDTTIEPRSLVCVTMTFETVQIWRERSLKSTEKPGTKRAWSLLTDYTLIGYISTKIRL